MSRLDCVEALLHIEDGKPVTDITGETFKPVKIAYRAYRMQGEKPLITSMVYSHNSRRASSVPRKNSGYPAAPEWFWEQVDLMNEAKEASK